MPPENGDANNLIVSIRISYLEQRDKSRGAARCDARLQEQLRPAKVDRHGVQNVNAGATEGVQSGRAVERANDVAQGPEHEVVSIPMYTLQDKVALITGASQGIGRSTALALVVAGAKVAVAARNGEKLTALVAEIEAAGGAALAVPLDVADPAQVKTGFQQILTKFGRLDILVNNAAITRDTLALRMKLEDWEAVLRTNLTGAHLCIQQALGAMLRQRSGRIINITSVVAQTGNAGQANYVASKAGLIGLTRAIAVEVASRSITVNCIAPGFIATPMTDPLSTELKDKMKAMIPLGRFGSDRDVSTAIVFLASDEAGYITGQVLDVNGGLHMG